MGAFASKRTLKTSQRLGGPLAVYLAFVLVLSLGLQTAQAETRRYTKTINADTEAVIGIGTRSNAACKSIGVPQIVLDNAPERGIVCIRNGPVKLSNLLFGKAYQCLGVTMDGVQIVYRAYPGFTGTDTVGYTMTFPRGERSYSVGLTITPGAARPE